MHGKPAEKFLFTEIVSELFFVSCHVALHMQCAVCCSCILFMLTVVMQMSVCSTLSTIAISHESLNVFFFAENLIADLQCIPFWAAIEACCLCFAAKETALLPSREQNFILVVHPGLFLYFPQPCANTVQVLVRSSISAIVVTAFQ